MLKGRVEPPPRNSTKGRGHERGGRERSERRRERGEKVKTVEHIGEQSRRAGGGSARLHFRLRSAELKGGPCTNETQFHATLSLPVLFPGFHFH